MRTNLKVKYPMSNIEKVKPMINSSLLLILFVFCSCDVSTNPNVINSVKMKVNITIQDGTNKNTLNYIKVKLSDGKKQIINKNIKILLNNNPLELFVRQGNYYDTYSHYGTSYGTDELLRKDYYYFELILPDSTKLPLAFIKPNKISTKFNIPKNISTDEDFVLKWTKLDAPYEFEYIKGLLYERKEDNITESSYAGKHIDTLTTKEGKYLIPKSYFTDSLNRTKRLETKLTRKENGLINPCLLKSSTIKYHHIIERTIYIKEGT